MMPLARLLLTFFLLLGSTWAKSAIITSTSTGGNWSSTSSWAGGAVPVSTDSVKIITGSTITMNLSTAATVRRLEISGTLNFASGSGSLVINGGILVNSGGKLDAYNGTTGKSVTINGHLTNNGSIEFSRTGSILKLGQAASATSISGSGNFNIIRQLTIDNANGVVLSSAISISNTFLLNDGTFTNGSNLTVNNTVIGNGTASAQCIIQRSQSSALANTYTLGATASLYISYVHNSAKTAGSISEGNEMPASRSLFRITVNNAAGILLTDDVTLRSSASALVLTAGIISLPAGKTIICNHVNNTNTSGSSTSYVNGGLAMAVGTTAAIRIFPIGSDGQSRKVTLSGLSASTGTLIVRFAVEASASPLTGSGLTALSTQRVWKGSILSGTMNNYTGITIDHNPDDSIPGSVVDARIAKSGSLSGTYNSLGADVNTFTTIKSPTGIYTSLGWFALGVLLPATSTYYIAANGNDAANGKTTATAWKTLNKVNAQVFNTGDSILFRRGDTFNGKILIKHTANLYIDAYGTGAKPVISGSALINTTWTVYSGNIWQTTFSSGSPAEIRSLIKGSSLLPISRFPNPNVNNGYLNFESFSGNTQITDNELSGSPNWTGAEFVLRSYPFRLIRTTVTTHSGNTITFPDPVDTGIKNGFGYFFVNDLKAIDQEGEWAYKPSTGTIYVFASSDPNSNYYSFAKEDIVVQADTVNQLVIKNLDIKYAGKLALLLNKTTGAMIDGVDISYSGGDGIVLGNSNQATIQNSSVSHVNWSGIYSQANSDHITISHNDIADIGDAAYGKGKTFTGIDCNSANSIVSYNKVVKTGYSGIISAGVNNLIKRNVIDSVVLLLNDNGGIYTNDNINKTNGTLIEENIITNSIGEYLGAPVASLASGIYLDNLSEGITVSNNTVAFVNGYGLYGHLLQGGNKFYDNTSFQSALSEMRLHVPASVPETDVRGNILVTNDPAVTHNVLLGNIPDYTYAEIGVFAANYVINPFNDKTIRFNYKEGSTSPNIRYNSVYEWEAAAPQISGTVASPLKYPPGTTPSDVIKFYCNTAATSQSFTLPAGSFIDVKNQGYCGTITLAPYSSAVLLKASTVSCLTPNSCGLPENMVVTPTSDTTATVSWNAVPAAINYDVRYKGNGETDWKYNHNVFGTSALMINLDPEKTYEYQLRSSCYGTESDWVTPEDSAARATLAATAAKANQAADLKNTSAITSKVTLTAYPNPFKKQTTVAFNIPATRNKVILDVYNLAGSRVQRLFEGKANGEKPYEFEFDRKLLSAGVYFIRLTTPQNIKHFKVIIID
jgi:hypothetical protein